MLGRSHRRLEERLSELQQAAGAIVRERTAGGEMAAIEGALVFLEGSAARHEADEEESLFPRLRAAPGGGDIAPLLDDLAAEHILHRHLVAQLRSLRNGWPDTGPDAAGAASLAILVNEMARQYRSHVEHEERELMPAARERLGQADREAILGEMDRRRLGNGRGGAGGATRRRYPAGSTGPRVRGF